MKKPARVREITKSLSSIKKNDQ